MTTLAHFYQPGSIMNNVDPQEIQKFNEFAKIWWDPNGDMKPLHQLNPLRLQFINEHAELNNKTVLDLGCGGGILTESLAKAGANAYGIDMSEKIIQVAKQHAEQNKLAINYQMISAEEFAQQHSQEFDVITCMEMLEHVPDPRSILQAAATLLKPQGKLFVSTINRNLKSYLMAIVGAEYVLRLLPRGTHEYAKFIRPSELRQWAFEAGFTLKKIKGMAYQPFTQEFSLTDDVAVNYLVCFEKI